MDYLDFAIEVHAHQDSQYVVAVRSPVGEARMTVPFPLTDGERENHLLRLENAILYSANRRRSLLTPEEATVQNFGQALFTFLLRDELLSRFRACQQLAHDKQQGVRIKLTVSPPELAGLPWELLYDTAQRDYLCLDVNTPLVRYPELPLPIQPLPVTSPLRILALCVGDTRLGQLNVAEERARMNRAVAGLQARGLVELVWLDGQRVDDLQRALRHGPWHIFHFIGHGGFDVAHDEGQLWLADDTDQPTPLYATHLARLLASQRHNLRLVLLNACDGARGGRQDLFSSTAAILVGRGIPAVLAMQYAITDTAAVRFGQTFYEALADSLPVDRAVADARNAMISHNHYSLEWAIPVLYLRSPDGRLFNLAASLPSSQPTIAPPPLIQPDPKSASPVPSIGRAELARLRQLFADLYPDEESARRVVADAGLDGNRIAFSSHATNNWHAILSEAEKRDQIDALLDAAAKEYGENLPLLALVAARKLGREEMYQVSMSAARPTMAGQATRGTVQLPIDFDWVTIPAGEFTMGSDKTKDKKADDNELPQHRFYLPDYHITRVPVTNAQYKQFVAAESYEPPSHWEKGEIPQGKENHPVVYISWQDAQAFCAWAGVHLPTEAEWEKAARGTDGRIWPWGNALPDKERCNFNGNVGDTTVVGNFPKGSSPYDVLDMAGNVWEWTRTLWGQNVGKLDFGYPYNANDGREDPADVGRRVVRGGSFVDIGYSVRCACRALDSSDNRYSGIGFRVMFPGG